MNYKPVIVAGLIAAGTFTGGYFLGNKRAEAKRMAASKAEIEELRELVATQHRLLAHESNVDWEAWKKLDPVARKHMIIALWYGAQDMGNYYIGLETGHKWGPVWNRRSPISILDEQTDVMKAFLADLRRLEESSASPPKYPTEDNTDPMDGSKIDWENFLNAGDDKNSRAIWFGKSKKSGRWMAYEFDKGVYEPDQKLSMRIINSKKADEESEKPNTDGSLDPFSKP